MLIFKDAQKLDFHPTANGEISIGRLYTDMFGLSGKEYKRYNQSLMG